MSWQDPPEDPRPTDRALWHLAPSYGGVGTIFRQNCTEVPGEHTPNCPGFSGREDNLNG